MIRSIILVAFSLGTLILIVLLDPIPQDLAYHKFADTRSLANIPNFLDIFSNLPFLLTGLCGFSLYLKANRPSICWLTLFIGVFLVAIGSSYYHLNPNNQTLVWDRLPMAIGFMGLFVALLSEWLSPKLEWTLIPMCLLAAASVYYWHIADDLRFYAWIQFFPLLFIILVGALFRPNIPHINFLYLGLACYALSKITEHFDHSIYKITNEVISGHSIKHLAAAFGTYYIYVMLAKRFNKSHG